MQPLHEHLLALLTGEDAHLNFESSIKDVPQDARGKKPKGAEHSLWEILEHLRICQSDILEFVRDAKHVSPEFSAGYWPKSSEPPSKKAWDESVNAFRSDLAAMVELVKKSKDPVAPIPHCGGKTLLREVLVLADHNSYHLGQFVQLRKLLGAWS